MQSRRQSLTESAINTAVGFIGSFLILELVTYFLNVNTSPQQNIVMVLVFTIWSLVRNYLLRRIFNSWHEQQAFDRIAAKHFNEE